MREQPCRDASAQHTPAVSTCALPAGLLARRSTGVRAVFPRRIASVTRWNESVAAYSCGGSSGFEPEALTEFPFHRTSVRTVAPQDIGSNASYVSTYCGLELVPVLRFRLSRNTGTSVKPKHRHFG